MTFIVPQKKCIIICDSAQNVTKRIRLINKIMNFIMLSNTFLMDNVGRRSILVIWIECRFLDTEVDGSNPGNIMLFP